MARTLSAFGKLPASNEFVDIDNHEPFKRYVFEWLKMAIYLFKDRAQGLQDLQFSLSLPPYESEYLGIIKASEDGAGRHFPLVMYQRMALPQSLATTVHDQQNLYQTLGWFETHAINYDDFVGSLKRLDVDFAKSFEAKETLHQQLGVHFFADLMGTDFEQYDDWLAVFMGLVTYIRRGFYGRKVTGVRVPLTDKLPGRVQIHYWLALVEQAVAQMNIKFDCFWRLEGTAPSLWLMKAPLNSLTFAELLEPSEDAPDIIGFDERVNLSQSLDGSLKDALENATLLQSLEIIRGCYD